MIAHGTCLLSMIYVFLSHKDCHNLATNLTEHQYDRTTRQDSIDLIYMLEGSNITANICASTRKLSCRSVYTERCAQISIF